VNALRTRLGFGNCTRLEIGNCARLQAGEHEDTSDDDGPRP
jgi:hypothetical protein